MPILDFLVWILGICGLAHFLVIKEPLQDHIFLTHRNNPGSKLYAFAEKAISFKLFTCPACVTLSLAVVFVDTYFNSEIFLTKLFICFTTYMVSLISLRFIDAN